MAQAPINRLEFDQDSEFLNPDQYSDPGIFHRLARPISLSVEDIPSFTLSVPRERHH